MCTKVWFYSKSNVIFFNFAYIIPMKYHLQGQDIFFVLSNKSQVLKCVTQVRLESSHVTRVPLWIKDMIYRA